MAFRWSHIRMAGLRLPMPRWRMVGGGNVTSDFAPLLGALYRRQRDGEVTTLRDLHMIAALPQSRALKMVRGMEERRLVRVGSNPHDRLGSQVHLTPQAMAVLSISRSAA